MRISTRDDEAMPMIIEERCYVLHATFTVNDYLDVFRREGLEIQQRTLGGLIGYFTTEVGELNAIVSLWEYASFDERLRRREALAADPAWQRYLTQVRPMISSMTNRLMNRAV
jgi:hypothetical protein